uniref:Serine-threonine/tyrosine-protein kinase catalytic domain-containing protein n=1 Tax=Oryza meridionalis TaxID=40149 RepID=A0A0E0DAE1_9ORYZ
MERLIILGLWCSAFETKDRPTMQQAMDVLERNAPLPDHYNFITDSAFASSDHDASSASVANSYEEAPLIKVILRSQVVHMHFLLPHFSARPSLH